MERQESSRRMFTLEEATALLPVIQPQVADLLGVFKDIQSEIEQTAGATGLALDSPDLAGHLQARGVVSRLFDRVKKLIEGIHAHGCVVNGPEAGLIDFPCLLGGEVVFLCWKFGEPAIGHWHRIPDGFAGRKPLLDPDDTPSAEHVH